MRCKRMSRSFSERKRQRESVPDGGKGLDRRTNDAEPPNVCDTLKLKRRSQEDGKDAFHGEHGTPGNKPGDLFLPQLLSYGTMPGPSRFSRKKPVAPPHSHWSYPATAPSPTPCVLRSVSQEGAAATRSHFSPKLMQISESC